MHWMFCYTHRKIDIYGTSDCTDYTLNNFVPGVLRKAYPNPKDVAIYCQLMNEINELHESDEFWKEMCNEWKFHELNHAKLGVHTVFTHKMWFHHCANEYH